MFCFSTNHLPWGRVESTILMIRSRATQVSLRCGVFSTVQRMTSLVGLCLCHALPIEVKPARAPASCVARRRSVQVSHVEPTDGQNLEGLPDAFAGIRSSKWQRASLPETRKDVRGKENLGADPREAFADLRREARAGWSAIFQDDFLSYGRTLRKQTCLSMRLKIAECQHDLTFSRFSESVLHRVIGGNPLRSL